MQTITRNRDSEKEIGLLDEERKGVLFGDAAENGKLLMEYGENHEIFRQGEPAESVFYLEQGMVELSVKSHEGKEAIVATLGSAEFFGEECLAGQRKRLATATTVTQCSLVKIERKRMSRMLQEQPEFAESFITHLVSRNIRCEADLVDQLFNTSEERLARTLLLLSHVGKESRTETIVPGINQEDLAQMVGTTRSWVSHFLNKFRKLGYIDYGSGGITVKAGLRTVVAHRRFPCQSSLNCPCG